MLTPPKFRFRLDQVVQVTRPHIFACKELPAGRSLDGLWICPGSARCRLKRHEVCFVKPGPLYNLLVVDLDLDLDTDVVIGEVRWFTLSGLAGIEAPMVPATSSDEVKDAIKTAFIVDLGYLESQTYQTIFQRVGTHWGGRCFGVVPSDPIPREVGELTIDQLFGFFSNEATGEVDFGRTTTLKDAATECAGKLAHAAKPVETSEADLNRRMVALELKLAEQAKDADECKREVEKQQLALKKCMKQLASHADQVEAMEWSSGLN